MTTADALLDAGVSEREAEVLSLIGDHLTNAEISARLYISVRTVESHVSSLLRKLGVGDRRALAELAAAAATPVPAPATPATAARPSPRAAVLPSPLTSFVGRAAERAALAEAVQQQRLVTAVGPGGVGKTRLALAVAADVADRFADGVWYVDLVPVTDPAMIAPAVAAALGTGEQSGRSIEDTVANRLAGARALVVLDNAEHLVDGLVVFVERLLGACPHVAVLATSRARLLVPFESTFPVTGLSVTTPASIAPGSSRTGASPGSAVAGTGDTSTRIPSGTPVAGTRGTSADTSPSSAATGMPDTDTDTGALAGSAVAEPGATDTSAPSGSAATGTGDTSTRAPSGTPVAGTCGPSTDASPGSAATGMAGAGTGRQPGTTTGEPPAVPSHGDAPSGSAPAEPDVGGTGRKPGTTTGQPPAVPSHGDAPTGQPPGVRSHGGAAVEPAAGDAGAGGGTEDVGDAVALFLARAAAVGGLPPDAGELRRIAAICRDLDGMALAIELAAARLPTLGLDGLEAGLADQLQLLAGGQRLDDRHRSLRTMLDWSCALLDEADRRVLWWVSLFASPFTADAAATLLDPANAGAETADGVARPGPPPARTDRQRAVAAALARLADQSLLVVTSGPAGTRYRMLETIRQYGSAQLTAAGDDVAGRTAHLRWGLGAATDLLDDPDTDRGAWRAGFDAVADDLRAALLWAEQRPDQRDAAHGLALRLADLAYARGLAGEAQRRYVEAAGLTDDDAAAAAALRLGAGAAMNRHVGNAAMDLFRRAADLAVRSGHRGAAARDLAMVAMMLTRAPGLIAELPPPDEATKLLAEAWRLAISDAGAGVDPILLTAESFHGAEVDPLTFDLANRAIELSRRNDDIAAESAALDQLTAVHLAHGQVYAAAACARRRIEILAPLPQSAALGVEVTDGYQMATETALGSGDLPAALRFAEQVHALPVYREEPHLGTARLLTVEALIGHWDRVLELAVRFHEGWERAGRQVAGNLALGASAVAMVHGLRGDEPQRAEWAAIVTHLRASYRDRALPGVVFNPVFDATVLLHEGRPADALEGLGDDPGRLREWFTGMWTHWYAALWAEASVLDDHPQAGSRLARARWITAGNPVAAVLVRRAEALAEGDLDRLPGIAADLEAAGCLYQAARTLALAGGEAGRRGEAALAALGAAPMATATR